MNSYKEVHIAYFTKEYNIYSIMDVNDLQARMDRLLAGDVIDDVPDEPSGNYVRMPQPVHQPDDLEERLAYIMLLNELDDADRREEERVERELDIERRSRRQAIREIDSMYPPMTSEPPVRRGRIETGPLMPGRRYAMPGTIPYELQELPGDVSSRINDRLPSHRRDPRRDRAARRIQSRVRTRRQRKKYLRDLYNTMWN